MRWRVAELREFGVDTRFVGVEPGTVTPLAFAVLDPPEDPQLLFRRDPPVPDFQLQPGEVDAADRRATCRSCGSPAARCRRSRARRRRRACSSARGRRRHTVLDLDYRPTFWRSREEASARIGAARRSRHDRGRQPRGVRGRGRHRGPARGGGRLRARGVELAIVKLGGDGVLLSSDEGERLIEPPPIEVLCGLGAGDAFGGALCHGLLSGWPHERTVAFANAAGGIVASRLLCSQAMPYEQEVVELLDGLAGMSATAEPKTSAAGPSGARRRRIGVGVIGFGWLGQAHTRSLLRIPTLFEQRAVRHRARRVQRRAAGAASIRRSARSGSSAPRRRGSR